MVVNFLLALIVVTLMLLHVQVVRNAQLPVKKITQKNIFVFLCNGYHLLNSPLARIDAGKNKIKN
jgi:hypothetical protein